MEINKIHQGHVLDLIPKLKNKSISLSVTSPPYWGLRDYETELQIWGGYKHCDHDFKLGDRAGLMADNRNFNYGSSDILNQIKNSPIYIAKYDDTKSYWCIDCGAWLGSLGLESRPEYFVENLVFLFDMLKPKLRDDGALWVNLGDTSMGGNQGKGGGHTNFGKKYEDRNSPISNAPTSFKHSEIQRKSQSCIPDLFKILMIYQSGWVCRSDVIWEKPNATPQSIEDTFTPCYERFFFFTKNPMYYFEQQFEPSISKSKKTRMKSYSESSKKVPSKKVKSKYQLDFEYELPNSELRNKRNVFHVNTKPFKGSHFATFPPKLIRTPILACCPKEICVSCGKVKYYKKIKEDVKRVNTRPDKNVRPDGLERPPNDWEPRKTIGKELIVCNCGTRFEPGVVLDPFMGAGTTGVVAQELNRNWIGFELNKDYIKMAEKRISKAKQLKKRKEKRKRF